MGLQQRCRSVDVDSEGCECRSNQTWGERESEDAEKKGPKTQEVARRSSKPTPSRLESPGRSCPEKTVAVPGVKDSSVMSVGKKDGVGRGRAEGKALKSKEIGASFARSGSSSGSRDAHTKGLVIAGRSFPLMMSPHPLTKNRTSWRRGMVREGEGILRCPEKERESVINMLPGLRRRQTGMETARGGR